MNSLTTSISNLFERDVISLINEILAYPNDDDLWKIAGEIKNPGGNLALHIAGNLRYYIGHVLNDSGYKRDRKQEFSIKNVSKDEIVELLETANVEVRDCLENMKEERLNDPFPIDVLGYETTVLHFLLHLYGHLNYHLGQINYHRRMIEK